MRIELAKINGITSNLLICLCLIAVSASSASAANRITFYRDGALLQQEAIAVKGVIDITLDAGLLEHTLTIVPGPGIPAMYIVVPINI